MAIGAGMAQFTGKASYGSDGASAVSSRKSSVTSLDNGAGKTLESDKTPATHLDQKENMHPKVQKPLLRVDAVLGEWLNPGYFESMTPPPSSVLMVASAKAELLRPGDFSHITTESVSNTTISFPGGWGSTLEGNGVVDNSPLSRVAGLARALPRRDRASSHNDLELPRGKRDAKASPLRLHTQIGGGGGGYVAPIPKYAISPSEPIPPGYVAHARDACVEVDLQWDSMREPQEWGDGGAYGEEWGALHKRCRSALQKILTWYRDHEPGTSGGEAQNRTPSSEDDAATDTVLILVSHGAPCNALIGALTDSPVLMDLGMASLTLAVCKDDMSESLDAANSGSSPKRAPARRLSSTSVPVSESYEMKLVGSTEHLRASSSYPPSPSLQTRSISPSLSLRRHRNHTGSSSIDAGASYSDRTTRSGVNSALGSMRRSSQSASPVSLRASSPTTATDSPTGLWHKAEPTNPIAKEESDQSNGDGGGMHTGADGAGDAKPGSEINGNGSIATKNREPGLWGPTSDAAALKDSEKASKRRWTVNDPA